MTWILLLSLILVALVVNIIISVRSQNTVTRRMWRAAGMLEDSINSLAADMELLKKSLLAQNESLGTFLNTYKDLRTGLDSCILQRKTLDKIEDRLETLIRAEIANQSKKGEANRTLRKRIQHYKEVLDASHKQMLSAWTSRDKAVKMAELLHEELRETRKFLEEARLPMSKLTRHLEEHFKGNIPGVIYAAALNEIEMRKQIVEPLTEKASRQPDDAA